jgi:RNA polymerase sigma-70 factor (ECF subfamily)
MPTQPHPAAAAAVDDRAIADRVAHGDHRAFEALMRLHNGKLFRIARATLGDDADAEDALQDAYLDAYRHIGEFRGEAALGTWLSRIVINRSLMRLRSRRRHSNVLPMSGGGSSEERDGVEVEVEDTVAASPQEVTLRGEVRRLLESKIDELPVAFRTVFVLREIEDMTVQETADCLSIPAATVRTRLFRARALLREAIARDLDASIGEVFAFAGARCDRIVAAVLERVRTLET